MNARSFAVVTAAFFSTAIAYSQEYRVRSITLGQGVPGPEVHVHQDGGAPDAGVLSVKSFLNHEKTTMKLKGGKIVLTTHAGGASAKDPAQLIGSCELPAKGGSAILLLLPEKPGSPACKIVVLDDSKESFPAGSYKVANLSSLPVKIELEKKPFDFKPGEIRNIEDPPVNAANSSSIKGSCESSAGWKMFSSSMWPHPGKKRVLQVIIDNADTKLVDIRGFRDVSAP